MNHPVTRMFRLLAIAVSLFASFGSPCVAATSPPRTFVPVIHFHDLCYQNAAPAESSMDLFKPRESVDAAKAQSRLLERPRIVATVPRPMQVQPAHC